MTFSRILACLLCALTAMYAQRSPGNAQFLRYPFDQWAAENAKPQIRWAVHADPVHLSSHQRLIAQFHLVVDSAELKKRQESGQILTFVRIEDSAGHRYQADSRIAIALPLRQGEKFSEVAYNISAFVLPGDYIVSLAVCDAKTLEHSFLRQQLHVAPIKSDPLPEAWKVLPAVEFLPDAGIPENWYLPQLRSRIALPVATERPVRIELLVNTTPSEHTFVNMFRANIRNHRSRAEGVDGIAPVNRSIESPASLISSRRALTYQRPDLHVAAGPADQRPGDWMRRSDWVKFASASGRRLRHCPRRPSPGTVKRSITSRAKQPALAVSQSRPMAPLMCSSC